MTIITKPITEKKAEKLVLPPTDNDQLATGDAQLIGGDAEAPQDPHFIFLRARARRVSTRTTLCLLLTALIVVSIGIICGTYLYRQYLRSQIFKGWCNFPVEQQQPDAAMLLDTNFIQEEFEIDVNRGEYEKINVPDFRDGRSGRFIHDFNTNKTGIVDITGQRCFIMPLDRNSVLPPKSLFDLIQKIWDGYYKVNTEIVRETMMVVTPPIEDASEAGSYIAKECSGMNIYRLEKYVGGVVKRSADLHTEAKFAQFSGKGITEFDIINLEEAQAYEEAHKNTH
ncbi:integral transmembrane protein 2 [Holotrichia oblita]|uniref:Integral transmembrane protein 2 n=1 Tax=Holotrichia oblita TaxID=644536 RepID=A0ACB9TBT4_HOLOL|nr:integral transmembrane protein 2 [Holotrichia oblita]